MDRFEDIVLSVQQDRRYYSVEHEDPTVRTEFEGGYVASRPRHNRDPLRRTFTTGFTDLSMLDRKNLEAFWNAQKGGSKIFLWKDVFEYGSRLWAFQNGVAGFPTAPVEDDFRFLVRFTSKFKFISKGYGMNLRYDCTGITMEEA